MKICSLSFVLLSTTAFSLYIGKPDQAFLSNGDQDLYLVELAPGETKWVTEDEKWALRRVCSYHSLVGKKPLAVKYKGN